jgi:hypothetical protein
MRRPLYCMALVAMLLMPAAYAQTSARALPRLEPGQSLGLALGMQTVPNLRDVGGCETSDDETVARGIAYGSDAFNPMSAQEIKGLKRLALKND